MPSPVAEAARPASIHSCRVEAFPDTVGGLARGDHQFYMFPRGDNVLR